MFGGGGGGVALNSGLTKIDCVSNLRPANCCDS